MRLQYLYFDENNMYDPKAYERLRASIYLDRFQLVYS
jgi:hypothetical protein